MTMDHQCSCKKCIKCCYNNPGWFGTKEQIIESSKVMGCKTLKEFADKYLIQEYWVGEDNTIIPAPRRSPDKTDKEKDEEKLKFWREELSRNQSFHMASWGHNLIKGFACVFLDDNDKCKIHDSKPTECKKTFGCKENKNIRKKVIKYWESNQQWVRQNLM